MLTVAALGMVVSSTNPSSEETFVHSPGSIIIKDPTQFVLGKSLIVQFPSTTKKPLKLAISAAGLTKDKITEARSGDRVGYRWHPIELQNMALPGCDQNNECGEDALLVAHDGEKKYSDLDISCIQNDFTIEGLPLPVSIKNEAINSLVFGIADGVGGMAEYGGNETAFMSHELMRLCGEAIKTTTTSAKIILQTAWDALIKEDRIKLGSTTVVLTLIKPSTTDPNALTARFASVGDSTCVVFRPIFNAMIENQKMPNGYKPLMMSWPLHHKANSPNTPPLQLAILKYILPNPLKYDNQVLYGQDFSNDGTDLPWMAQEGETELRKGDVIAVFSDGIGDNLRQENLVGAVHVMYEHILHAFKKPNTIPFLLHGAYNEYCKRENNTTSIFNSDITDEQENALAGNASALLASTIIRYCQRSWKVDDMSIVVGIVI